MRRRIDPHNPCHIRTRATIIPGLDNSRWKCSRKKPVRHTNSKIIHTGVLIMKKLL